VSLNVQEIKQLPSGSAMQHYHSLKPHSPSPMAGRRYTSRQYRGSEANYVFSFVARFKIIATSATPRIQKVPGLNHPVYTNRPLVTFTLKWNDKSPCKRNKTEDEPN
jgi:hypothetical protein